MPEEITIPGTKKKIPSKVLLFAVGGGVVLFLLTRRRGEAPAPAEQSDGLLASEYNQRLQEQHDALSGIMSNREGVIGSSQNVTNPTDTIPVNSFQQPQETTHAAEVSYIPQSWIASEGTPSSVLPTNAPEAATVDSEHAIPNFQPYTRPKVIYSLSQEFAMARKEGRELPTMDLYVTGPGGTRSALPPIPAKPLEKVTASQGRAPAPVVKLNVQRQPAAPSTSGSKANVKSKPKPKQQPKEVRRIRAPR